jgi:hypothetical protein
MAIGVGDEIDGGLYAWDWELKKYDDSSWEQAKIITPDDLRSVEGLTG